MNPKTKTIGLFIATFLLGVILGALVFPDPGRTFGKRGSPRQGYREMFRERVQLTDEQAVLVDSVLERYRLSMDVQRVAFQRVRDSLRADINTLLTDEQKILYTKYLEETSKRENRHASDTTRGR